MSAVAFVDPGRADTVFTCLDDLAPIGLDALVDAAELLERVDRKYVIGPAVAERVLDGLARAGDTAVLDIDGRRAFAYRSVYFDTADFDLYLAAARRRPRRAKVRTRRYLDTDTCFVEVKLRDVRGHTAKHRRAHPVELERVLTSLDRDFIGEFASVAPFVDRLRPAIVTSYLRRSLLSGDQRVTVDVDVECRSVDGRTVGFGDHVIVETKSAGRRPGPVDRELWALGARPCRVSKYAVGAAALHPGLPANAVTVARLFGTSCITS